METTNFDTISFDDDFVGFEIPQSKGWKKSFKFIENFSKNNFNNEESERVVKDTRNMLELLVKEGNAYEDLVLNTALLYYFIKKTGVDFESIKQNFDHTITEGVEVLLSNNLKEIFESKTMAYLNKIKLAEYVLYLTAPKTDNLVESIKAEKEINEVIKKYNGKTHKGLMKLLINTKQEVNN